MTPHDRVAAYARAFPQWPDSVPWVGVTGRLYGVWIYGQDYRRRAGYHGEYPPNHVARVMALFPDARRVLHLFSGSLPKGDYTRFDIRGDVDCDVRGDAHRLSSYFSPGSFDLVLADPPYTAEDADHYGTPMVNRTAIMRELRAVVEPGGTVVWLDQVLPMFRKDEWHLSGVIGVVRSTNHRVRSVFMFRRAVEERAASQARSEPAPAAESAP